MTDLGPNTLEQRLALYTLQQTEPTTYFKSFADASCPRDQDPGDWINSCMDVYLDRYDQLKRGPDQEHLLYHCYVTAYKHILNRGREL